MRTHFTGLLPLCLAASLQAADTNNLSIIPLPQRVDLRDGVFRLTAATRIYADPGSKATAEALARRLRAATRYPLELRIESPDAGAVPGGIVLTTQHADTHLGPEGYELNIEPGSIVIRAPGQAGLFYAGQTLLQVFPPELLSLRPVSGVSWQAPCLRIQDWPRFKWRGFMLDVSRHFFTKAEVKTFLDGMAFHKLNVFHWHLTDDQGWRIEIKKYPKLTEVGAWRAGVGFGFDSNTTTAYGPDGRYGGFYTQADIREVVDYAAARHIAVVPEIEMPGHATAALSAYPQFSCTGGPFEPCMTAGIFKGIYDPAKEETFEFLNGVLSEVAALFPGPYIHIGGDEVSKDTWKNSPDCQVLMKREGLKNEEELQSWFIRRLEKTVSAQGHRLIGWSEILQGGLPQNAVVMDWVGGAREAALAGHDVVMSPTAWCYFDYYQSSNHVSEPEAAAWGGPLTLRKVYRFEPMPANVPPRFQEHILGAQGNLWTEHIPNFKLVQYMTFPRACALAEVTWSDRAARDWEDFVRRLRLHALRLDQLEIDYRHASIINPNAD